MSEDVKGILEEQRGNFNMKYAGMPAGMWMLFAESFKKQLSTVLKYDKQKSEDITRKARSQYRNIIRSLPEFEKGDRFKMNIVSCAMFSAFLLSLDNKPTLPEATDYYRESMMTIPMKWFCRISGTRKFSPADIEGLKQTAALKAADRNPYSWNMDFLPYEDGSGYEARFTRCGICTLMRQLGLDEFVPAMCRLDYTMSEAGGVSQFVREHTIAGGGQYCDCGYKRKGSN